MLGDSAYDGAIAVVLGGDASCATNGFWSALTIATTQKLPMLFYIEDNGYGISVPSSFQTPGGDIATNLASFSGLHDLRRRRHRARRSGAADRRGGGPCPRRQAAPALLRLTVPRLEGHSFQDTQAYKSEAVVKAEWARDPLPKLKALCRPSSIGDGTRGGCAGGGRGGAGRGRSARRLRARNA